MNKRHNEGFTLVELLVTIVVGSIVTLAATTVLLLGLRLNKSSSDTVEQQNTTRTVITVLENLASQGTIKEIIDTKTTLDAAGNTKSTDWEVMGTDGVLLRYNSDSKAVYSGSSSEIPLLENVDFSSITLNGQLLTFTATIDGQEYTSSTYCRLQLLSNDEFLPPSDDPDDKSEELIGSDTSLKDAVENLQTTKARKAFLAALITQYGSPGVVIENNKLTYQFYSKWYNSSWPIDTPWCACYVSWALHKIGAAVNEPENNSKWFANVDYFMEYLKTNKNPNPDAEEKLAQNIWKYSESTRPEDAAVFTPAPGDLIFFDWLNEGEALDPQDYDPEHVGVVLKVDETANKVYTIEGNTGPEIRRTVAVREYDLNSQEIVGYGVLDWVPDPETSETESTNS